MMKIQSWLLVLIIAFLVIVFYKPEQAIEVEDIVYQQTEEVKPAAALSVDVQRDSDSPSTEINGDTQTKLFVVDAFDNSVASAVVHYYALDSVVGKIVVNAEGYALVDNDATIVGVIVMTDNRVPYYQKATFVGEDVRIKITAGEKLRGRVVFKDCDFDALFEVRVPLYELVDEAEVPIAVIEQLEAKSIMLMSAPLALSDEGIFEINGLPKSWSGRLRLSSGYWPCTVEGDGEISYRYIRLPRPVDDITINVHATLGFKGKIVATDTGEGVADVGLNVSPFFGENENNVTTVGGHTDQDGAFFIAITPNSLEKRMAWCADVRSAMPTKVYFSISNSEVTLSKQFEIDLRAMPDPWDIGELRVEVKKTKIFTVTDHNGMPLAKAVVVSSEVSKPTDSNGQTEVYPLSDEFEYRVGAEGYRTKSITFGSGDVLTCSLEPSATLMVHWPSSLPGGLERIQIQIESEGLIFNNAVYSLQRSFGHRLISRSRTLSSNIQTTTRWRLDLDASQQFFWDLKPNTIMKVCLVDNDGKVLTNKHQFVVSAKEKLSVDLSFL